MDMVKDISKYLFRRDKEHVKPSYMEDGPEVTAFIEECMELGLGISGQLTS